MSDRLPVWLRLLLIRLALRRATLGDAFDRMMQHRKENAASQGRSDHA